MAQERHTAAERARRWVVVGGAGTLIAALCCFTPVLVVVLGALGLSAWVGWLDAALLPALAVFAVILAVGLVRLRRRPAACCAGDAGAGSQPAGPARKDG